MYDPGCRGSNLYLRGSFFSTDELTSFNTTSRTFSVYYPDTRPDRKDPRYSIVASINAKWKDWQSLTDKEYAKEKNRLCEESVTALEKIIPDVRDKIDHLEAATPRTIQYYTQHASGASFGTKFEDWTSLHNYQSMHQAFITLDPLGSYVRLAWND